MFHTLGCMGAKGRAGALNAGPGLIPPHSSPTVSGSVHFAEDDDLLLGVPVERDRVVDEISQDLRVVGGGHDEGLLGPVVQDELVGELTVLQRSLAAPVGVDVGDLPNLYCLLRVLLAQGEPPHSRVTTRQPLPERPSVANACATHEKQRPSRNTPLSPLRARSSRCCTAP